MRSDVIAGGAAAAAGDSSRALSGSQPPLLSRAVSLEFLKTILVLLGCALPHWGYVAGSTSMC